MPNEKLALEPRLSLVTLGVEDLARSRRFYEEGLGWTASAASVVGVVAFYQLGAIALALFGRTALAADAGVPAAAAGFAGIALAHNVRTRDAVDAALAQAAAAGGRITKPAEDAAWGGRSGYFADPDGHLWEIAWNPHFRLTETGALELEPSRPN